MPRKWKKLYETDIAIVCPYCLEPIPEGHRTKDHKTPKSRGGKTDPTNIVICCDTCNHQKGALTAEEYAEWKRLEFIRNGGLTNKGKQR